MIFHFEIFHFEIFHFEIFNFEIFHFEIFHQYFSQNRNEFMKTQNRQKLCPVEDERFRRQFLIFED